ncbi:MAG: haloacid dehalogenase type II [Chloroflexota bacterium]|nr:haloacid dehalogenase type II [Chloroflexota bacterium]
MSELGNVKALAWDIGGTIFDWHHTIKGEVSAIAEAQGVELDAAAFTNMWRFTMFKRLQLVRRGDLPWLNADQLHRRVLDEVMEAHPQLKLDPSERDELNTVWHRMNAWPGSAECLEALRSRYKVTVLTVMSWAIAVDCSKHNGISWDGILSCEFLGHYKPEPEAYHASAKYLGLDISEVMMCAAHKGDLQAAARAGMPTAYVPVATERGAGNDPDMSPDPSFTVNATDFGDLSRQLLA